MRRSWIAGAMALALLAAVPMSAAVAAQRFRDPSRGGVAEGVRAGVEVNTFFFKASKTDGCGFGELVQFTVGGVDWFYSDGREVSVTNARINITNVESGISYLQTSTYHRTVTTRPDGTLLVVIDGSRWEDFSEGEPGPYGIVGPGGAEYFVDGHQEIFMTLNETVLSYSVTGRVLDACEILG